MGTNLGPEEEKRASLEGGSGHRDREPRGRSHLYQTSVVPEPWNSRVADKDTISNIV